jgi:hypothetical protein
MTHDPGDVALGRAAIARGILDAARARAILDRASLDRCGFVEGARRLGVLEPRALQALEALAATAAPAAAAAPTGSTSGSTPRRTGGLPAVGDTLGGFRLERVLGRGGMGAVFVGTNAAGMTRAIKVPLVEGSEGEAVLARFEAEARALAKVPRHPNVVGVDSIGREAGRVFCVLELVEGEGLDRLLAREGPLPIARIVELAETVALALGHVHASSILHRDLKPANVMVRASDGTPVLMDFGLARDRESKDRLTRTGVMLGTPAYMSPEQAEGSKEIDARADVYGMGAILYELLTRKPPFEGDSHVVIVKHVLVDDPVPPSRYRSDCPRDLETIVLRALAKEPEARYPTVRALAGDLGRVRREEPILARREGPRERLARRFRRMGTPFKVALVLGPLVLGASVAVAIASRKDRVKAWERDLGVARAAFDRARESSRPARLGLPVPASDGEVERALEALSACAADVRAPAKEGAEARREVEALGPVGALVPAEAALGARDFVAAKAILAKLPPTEEARLVGALVDLEAGELEPAHDALRALEGETKQSTDDRFTLEVEYGLMRVEDRLKTPDPPERAPRLESLIARSRSPASILAAVRRLAGRVKIRQAVETSRGGNPAAAARALEATKDVSQEDRDQAASEFLPQLLAVKSMGIQARAHALATLLSISPRAFSAPELAARFVALTNEALAKGDVAHASSFLEMARRADPLVPIPEDFLTRARGAALAREAAGDLEGWVDIFLTSMRLGLSVEYLSGDPATWLDKLLALLADRTAGPGGWAARATLAELLLGPAPEARRAEGVSLARALVADPTVPTAARNRVRSLLAGELVFEGHIEEGLALFETSIREGSPAPDEEAIGIALTLVRQCRFKEAIEAARRAIHLVDDRIDRTHRGTDALAEGRPRGLPLEAIAPGSETSLRLSCRWVLMSASLATGAVEDARAVVVEAEAIDDDRILAPIFRGTLLVFEGKTEEGCRAIRAGRDKAMTAVMAGMSLQPQIWIGALADILRHFHREQDARAVEKTLR